MIRFLTSALAMACCLCGAVGTAQPPQLSYALPTGIRPGQPIDITLAGTALANPTGLWTNLPGTLTLVPATEGSPAAERVTYRCELPADAAPGVYALRLATEHGISNVRLVMVDDLPTLQAAGDNVSPAAAQPLEFPVAVEGAVPAEGRHYYKFHAAPPQRLSVEVLAQHLGSPLDSQIRLLDAHGAELAFSDDDPATGSDSRLVHRFAAEGDYFLEIGDVRYLGGNDYRYRLRLGDFPLVTAPFPLGVQAGALARVEVTGTDLAELPVIEARGPANLAASQPQVLRLKAAYPAGRGAGAVALVVGGGPEQVEIEPNDRPDTASPVDAPGAVSGRFAADGDHDYFRFAVKKGTRLRIVGRTRSLGITRDLLLRLLDPQGKPLATGVAARRDDTQIDFSFPDDGAYTLSVEDLAGHGGPDHVYRLEFAPSVAGFSLAADAERYNVPRGGVFQIKIAVTRGGYSGPIQLAVVMPDVPLQIGGGEIAADKAEGVLTITAPESLQPGTWRTFHVVGRATIDGQPFEAQAGSLAPLQAALGNMRNPPAELDGLLALGVGPTFGPFIKLEAETPIVVPQLSGKATVKLKATRTAGFAGPITVAAEGLPAGFALAAGSAAVIKPGESEAALELTLPLAAAEGDYPGRIVATGTHSLQPGRAALEVTLRVVKPLAAGPPQQAGSAQPPAGQTQPPAEQTPPPAEQTPPPAEQTPPPAEQTPPQPAQEAAK